MSYHHKDMHYMQQALQFAQKAYDEGEVPIGALIVDAQGQVIGSGYNQTESRACQDQHAELCAIRHACAQRNDWRLDGCTIYVTLEPCVMCVGCIALSRIERLVYAADSPLFGALTSQKELGLSQESIYALYGKTIKNITTGIGEAESQKILKAFFKERRKDH